MAEFTEVMKQKERMCKYAEGKCDNRCDLHRIKATERKHCNHYIYNCPSESEEIIMKWAKNHPIKTNADKFKEVFGVEISVGSRGCNGFDCLHPSCVCDGCKLDNFWNREYKEQSEV